MYKASNYSIALTAAASSNLDSLVMQLLPTQLYQKRLCLCFQSEIEGSLPSKGLCHQSALAFFMEGPLPSRGLCGRRAFKVPFHSPSKGIYYVCHRRAFAFKVHLLLPSKGLCDRRALPSKGVCLASKYSIPLTEASSFLHPSFDPTVPRLE